MRAALLARVSSDQQADALSLPAQLRAMRERCEREGWEIVREYQAPGESAFTSDLAKRPVMAQILADCDFDILVIHESSRLARNERLAHEVLDRLTSAGVTLVNVASGIDYQSPEGRMFFGVEASLNAYWSRKMGEHIRKGKRERFERGLPVGDVPFGYRSLSPQEPPAIVPEEAEAIRWAFTAFGSGSGYLAIATEFNRRSLRPRSKRGLEAFTASSVQSIIENRFYAGVIIHRGEEGPGAHEPLITVEEWTRANSRVRRQGTHAPTTFDALLVGLTTCAYCGGPVWSNKSGPKMHTYYWEPSRVRGRECEAKGRKWRAESVDRIAVETVLDLRLDGDWGEEVRRLARRPVATGKERLRLTERKRRVTNAYTMGAIDDAEWAASVKDIDRELSALPPDEPARLIAAGEKLSGIAGYWEHALPRERNEIMRILLDRIVVDIPGQEIGLIPAPEFASYFQERKRWCEGTSTPGRNRGVILPSAFRPWELAS